MSADKPAVFLGIDPGAGGALAVLDPAGRVLELHDTPTLLVATSGRTKTGKARLRSEYDTAAMDRILFALVERYTVRRVAIERIVAMPAKRRRFAPAGAPPNGDGADDGEGRGSLAAVSLAEGVGLWRGLCAAYGLPVQRVLPQTWKAQLVGRPDLPPGLSRGKRSALLKERARARALELFPGCADRLARVKDHGRAESALLAEYGRRLG